MTVKTNYADSKLNTMRVHENNLGWSIEELQKAGNKVFSVVIDHSIELKNMPSVYKIKYLKR